MQAVVSGHPQFSAVPGTELNVSYADYLKGSGVAEAGAGAGAGEDSDDEEYVYVSRLAEQIAHAMLDEDDDDSAVPCAEDVACASYKKEGKLEEYSVSHFAATWRDNGPSEWDCFYTPAMLQQDARVSSSLRGDHQQVEQTYMFRGWSSLSFGDSKTTDSGVCDPCDLPSHWRSQPLSNDILLPKPKESIGTGVFLPKIVRTGSHYRRKVGLQSKFAYDSRSKF